MACMPQFYKKSNFKQIYLFIHELLVFDIWTSFFCEPPRILFIFIETYFKY